MIAKMRLVNLTVEESQLDDLLSKFIDYSGFHPVEAQQIVSSVHGAEAMKCQTLLKDYFKRLKRLNKK